MTVTNIAFLMVLWSAFTIVFEVPSGILADRWNRRNMLATAAALQGLCFIIWIFSHTFMMFALGFVFWAVAAAFISGTEEGLIYDNLKCEGCEDDFAKVYGKARFYANMGTITGIVSAGFIASIVSIETMALISGAICFVNVGLALNIREKNYYLEQFERITPGVFGTFKEAVTFIKDSRIALVSILFLVFVVSLGSYLDEYDALIINDFQLDHMWVSVILTIRFIFIALGDILAPAVQKKIATIRQIIALDGLACILLLLFTLMWHRYALLLFGLALMVMSITEILLVNVLQKGINEEGRATVLSFYGIGQNIMMIFFSLIYALLVDLFTLQQVYIFIAIYGIAGGFGFYLFLKLKKISI